MSSAAFRCGGALAAAAFLKVDGTTRGAQFPASPARETGVALRILERVHAVAENAGKVAWQSADSPHTLDGIPPGTLYRANLFHFAASRQPGTRRFSRKRRALARLIGQPNRRVRHGHFFMFQGREVQIGVLEIAVLEAATAAGGQCSNASINGAAVASARRLCTPRRPTQSPAHAFHQTVRR